ncbi:hypothetical protein COM40_12235 [Bacillus wiedmannii]|uniref:hypothetical protein n=1 Tax=Bacillus wiedmannii TaxID=1890302 RepID=UPI000BF79511|nr:hypothetical protein [Bacillus wiedmannii]PGD58130.1 hypothetical protein COM40_12235 [Bacillus wiedmannii]
MRHTRNRQLYKLTGDKRWHDTYNVTIEFNRKWAPLGLDPTFKWRRECYPWGHYVEFEKEVAVPPGKIEKRMILRKVK